MRKSTLGIIRKFLICMVISMAGTGMVIAQDSVPQPEQKPLAKPAFESGYFIADQTVTVYPAHTLEFVIQHDFGTIQNHWDDIWGIWGASNIRLGLNFTLSKNVLIGLGTTKNNLYQDFQIKYTFLHQRVGGFPLTISFYGDVALNATPKSQLTPTWGPNFTYVDRLNYMGEFMFARRFGKMISLQLGIGWVHYNLVDSAEMANNHVNYSLRNDNLNISGIGRIKVTPQTSIMLSYSQPVLTYLNTAPWPNFGVGVEISTSTHAFQIFLTSAQGMIPQQVIMYNNNNPYNGAILLGFNITRLWNL
jgi:hypothetical protein